MPVEIERKFLVHAERWHQIEKPEGVLYRQGYMVSSNLMTLRIRHCGDTSFLTIKGKTKGISRKEFEYEIPSVEALDMLDQLCEAEVIKTRYCIPHQEHVWEVDVFHGLNHGLIMAEIELSSEDEAFEKPDWVATEVSYDSRYGNGSFARVPFTTW